MAVKLPRKTLKCIHFIVCSKSHWLLCGRLWTIQSLNRTLEVTVSPLISTPASVPHHKKKVTI